MKRLAVYCALLLAAPVCAAELQDWTDRSGQFTIKAEFVELKDDKVVILKDAVGETIEIELDQLDVDSKVAAQKAHMQASTSNPFKKSGSSKPSPFKKSGSGESDDKGRGRMKPDDSGSSRSPRSTTPAKEFEITTAGPTLEGGVGNMFGGSSKSWKVEPDGRTYENDLPSTGLRVQMPNIHYRFKGLAMSLDGAAAVGMWHNPFGGRDGAPKAAVCKFDLADGKAGKPFPSQQDGFPVAVGEGGDTALIRTIPERGGSHQLILIEFNSTDASAIWTCVPFGESDDAKKQSISWAAILPNGNVAVAHHSEAFRVFNPETEKAVFDAKIPRHAVPAISPGGNQIALSSGGSVSIYDTDSFELLGTVGLPNERLGQRVCFSADGTEIAVAGGGQMAVIDASTGKIKVEGIGVVTSQIESPFDQPGTFVHAGGTLYLVNNQLVDTKTRMHVWTYDGLNTAGPLGDSTFLLFDISTNSRQILGIAGNLPHPPARELFDRYSARDDLYAFQPGDSIKIDTSSVPAADKQKVLDAFTNWAAKSGVRLADDAKAVLRLSTKSGNVVEQEYRSFGFGGGGTEKASFTPTLGVGTLTVDGREVWTGETGLSDTYLPFMIHQEVSKVVENARKVHYERYAGVAPPTYVFDPAVVKTPLGISKVSNSGFADTFNVTVD